MRSGLGKERTIITGRKLGYARISTTDQNLALQIDALKLAGCDVIYKDHGISGVKRDRPGLDKLLVDIKPGDVLVVWKLDRLGRSLSHLIHTLKGLMKRDISFCSLKDAIDTTTAGGRLCFHIMGALAEFERDLISERTKAGMMAAQKRGVHIGRPRKLTSIHLSKAKTLLSQGENIVSIASIFSVHPSTLVRRLNEFDP